MLLQMLEGILRAGNGIAHPEHLPAASRNVLAHLIDLSERNLATPEGEITATTRFSPAWVASVKLV